jgi:hypothetical protein
LKRIRNVRIYAGNYLAYYAYMVEFNGKPFMRPALTGAHATMMGIVTEANSGPSAPPPPSSGSSGSALNWKPNPGREKFLDEWFAARK